MELLLLSNSTLPGEAFFQWPKAYVANFLEGKKRIAFVPFAAVDEQQDSYIAKVRPVFEEMGIEVLSLHKDPDPEKTLKSADAVVIGGGNSFLLVRALHRTGLMRSIGDSVRKGMPYLGWSAGANVACPSIMTTNDMPIVEPPSFRAMNLVSFQINPHFTEDTIPGHGGESREQRIAEFLSANPNMPVVGLREGSLLHVNNERISLSGRPMKLFRHGKETKVIQPGREFRKDLSGL